MSTPTPTQSSEDEESAGDIDGISPGSPSGTRRSRAVIIGLTVLLAAAVTTSCILGWKVKQRSDIDRAAREALSAAQQYAVLLTSIDASRIDQDFTAIESGATGEFKDMYAKSAVQLKPLLVQAQSVSKGHVTGASIQSATREQVVAMLFVDAEITNATTGQPRVDRNRILITMDDVDGRWLASNVELV
ncbi:hypothetical protein [Nocardia noduli]|uniref:hypothetical protein n=1 Tax=Nocardia noduli TaxID=2815722 RepID=UPI001C226328|nr:hypothetical protein [Nocardia noduli]